MSESTGFPATGEQRQAEATAQTALEQKPLDDLHTEFGDTTIADTVVQKIAGIAAREVPGVYAMGTAARRALNSLTQRIPGGTQPNVTGGIAVRKGERETAIDIAIVIEYGAQVVEVSQELRENVIRAVESGTGLRVVAVDVDVTDVHLPEDDESPDGSGAPSRTVPSATPELR